VRTGTLLVLAALSAAAQVKLVSVEPTVLFPRATPLRQFAVVTLLNEGKQAVDMTAETRVAGEQWRSANAIAVPPGVSRQSVMVADIKAPAELEVSMSAAGQAPLQWKGEWQPQRKWKVYIMESAHEDLGYEDWIFNKQKEVADFIDLAKHLSGSPENQSVVERAAVNRYQYTLETLLFYRNYIEERGPAAWREVVEKYIKRGAMHLTGAPSGVHNHWMDYEELARNMYPGRIEMKQRYGLDLKTYLIVDNPSASWAAAQAAAQAGFKYIARWGQGWRTGGNNDYAKTKVPALFWWQGPNGKDKVLYGWRSHYGTGFWFGQTNSGNASRSVLGDMPEQYVSTYLRKVEAGNVIGPYPYDAIIEPAYGDHDVPYFDRGLLVRWTNQYAYPEIRVTGVDPFFEYIEKKYAAQLPVLSGDLNNFSADYATIDPESQGWKRRAARLLPLAEGLSVVTKETLSPARVERAYTRLFDYDEHSWPTLLPASDVQLFNAAWIKKQEAQRALQVAEESAGKMGTALAKRIASPEKSIAVFNGLAHPRTSLVEWSGVAPGLTDMVTGRKVPTQQRNGKTIFVAENVPAFGYKVFRIESASAVKASGLSVGPDRIANEFYEVRFDPLTGVVRSIREKANGKEWVDGKAAHGANQMVYVSTAAREAKPTGWHSPERAKEMRGESGPVAAEFRVKIEDAKTGAVIEQVVTLYAGLKRIDFVNDLRHVRSLYTDRFEDRYRENLFYAFPFAVEGGQIRAEAPGGVVRPYKDQMRWGSHDYLMANRWIDVSNSKHGVTMAPWNASTFHLGEIRYNQFSIDYEPKNSHLFSYAWSNRMAGLLTLSPEDMNATLGYSVTTHDGDWDSGDAARLGWDVATPLMAFELEENSGGPWKESAKSFLNVDVPNVELCVLKPSDLPGKGWIVRLVETAGKQSKFQLDLNALGAKKVWLTNLVEEDKRALELVDGKLGGEVDAFSFVTLRLESGDAPGTGLQLRANANGDSEISLSWTGTATAAYNVYRSMDAADPALAQTWIARVNGTRFMDRGLHPGTRYFYQVSEVSEANLQGTLARADATTGTKNETPPNVVDEPGVVRRAKDRLFVYWRRNQEPDVARYFVYRGDKADFSIAGREPQAVLVPTGKFLELFIDSNLQPGREYFYRIYAEDHAGNRQTVSPVVSGKTPQ